MPYYLFLSLNATVLSLQLQTNQGHPVTKRNRRLTQHLTDAMLQKCNLCSNTTSSLQFSVFIIFSMQVAIAARSIASKLFSDSIIQPLCLTSRNSTLLPFYCSIIFPVSPSNINMCRKSSP